MDSGQPHVDSGQPRVDSGQFRALVLEYGDAHSKLKGAAAEAAKWRARKKDLQESLLRHMQDQGIDECAWDGGVLVRKRKERTESLKKEHIVGELRKVVDADVVETVVANMYKRRTTDVRDVLTVRSEPT